MSNFLGKSIGRYQITELLGKGGMASVYKAFDTRLERYVAIKFIRADAINQEIFLKRFEREAKALARLSHPNIVKVLDYGSHENIPYIVMEYIPGGTLKQKLGRPLSAVEAARLILPIARTLDYTHRQNIIHRDVKPANFLIMENGDPMLTDFGIARMMEQSDAAQLTGTGTGIGTPEYMAPEQCKGEKVDQRADIYSLGIVFYELVTGAKPFTADTPMAVVMKHVTEPLPAPSLYVPGLSPQVEQALRKALAKNPADRFQSMAQFAAALEKLIESPNALSAQMTLKQASSANQPVPSQAPVLPQPVYNYPSAAPARPAQTPPPVEEKKKSRLGWWIGGGILGFMGCIVLAVVIFLGSNLLGGQQSVSITSTAQSLASTIQANQNIRTQEASQKTSTVQALNTASAASAEQTVVAQNTTATAQADQQNSDATATAGALSQSATQDALDVILADYEAAQQNWFTDYSDDFNTPDNWGTGNYESEWWQGSKTIGGGQFTWQMTALKGFYHYVTVNDTQYTNFLVSVLEGQTNGHENGETGLVLMQTDNSKYYFTVNSSTQRYEFTLYNNNEWTTLDTAISEAINPNEMNHIAILSNNHFFTIFINGEYVNQIEDDALSQGEIGITAGLSNADEQGTFNFDYINIQTP